MAVRKTPEQAAAEETAKAVTKAAAKTTAAKTTARKTTAKKPASATASAGKNTTVVVVTTDGTAKPRRKKTQSPMTKVKRKIAKITGIPTTASGRKKKAERKVADLLLGALDKIDKPKK